MPDDADAISDLELEFANVDYISIKSQPQELPMIEWTEGLSENDVLATLLKSILFMALDEMLSETIDALFEEEDEPDGTEG